MKEIVSFPVGSEGKAGLSVSEGNLMLAVSTPMGKGHAELRVAYPMAEVLMPIKVGFVDRIKALIPGEWDDVLLERAWAEAVASLSEMPAPAMIAEPKDV